MQADAHSNYLFPGYFTSEAQNAQRWTYYRCATEGQNTILLGNANQAVTMLPPTNFGSTGESQSSLGYSAPSTSAAFFTADLTTAYSGTNIQRGMRLVAGRQAMLLQDEITASRATAQWRVHTNATCVGVFLISLTQTGSRCPPMRARLTLR